MRACVTGSSVILITCLDTLLLFIIRPVISANDAYTFAFVVVTFCISFLFFDIP